MSEGFSGVFLNKIITVCRVAVLAEMGADVSQRYDAGSWTVLAVPFYATRGRHFPP